MYLSLTTILIFGLLYKSFSKKAEPYTGPGACLFILFFLFIGPRGIGVFDMGGSHSEVTIHVDLTLAMLLFSDAAGIALVAAKESSRLPSSA